MTKTVGFVLLEPFADWECAYLASALSMLGEGAFKPCFLSVDGRPIRSIGGLTVKADGDLSQAAQCDALILIGGLGWRSEAAQTVEPVIADFVRTGRPAGAICDAVRPLARMGLLNDRQHTGNGMEELMAAAPDTYTGQQNYRTVQAICDRHLTTGNGTAALEFALELLKDLGVEPQTADEWYQFHKQGFCCAPLPKNLA